MRSSDFSEVVRARSTVISRIPPEDPAALVSTPTYIPSKSSTASLAYAGSPDFVSHPRACCWMMAGHHPRRSVPRYPMRMWVRPPCDLSVPGEHNTGKGRGRKRRVECAGVSKNLEKFGGDSLIGRELTNFVYESFARL